METLGNILIWLLVTFLYYTVIMTGVVFGLWLGSVIVDALCGTNFNARFHAWREDCRIEREYKQAQKAALREQAAQQASASPPQRRGRAQAASSEPDYMQA